MKRSIMGHLVLGYPTLAESLETARTYVAAGIDILELQIPFSHPTADGSVITAACRVAVEEQQVTVTDCLAALRSLRQEFPEQEMMVMSYINRIYAYGVETFVAEMSNLNIRHLIVPDLPVDSLQAQALNNDFTTLVPVIAANITEERLQKLLAMDFDFYYLMADFKITGSSFSLNPQLEQVILRLRQRQPAPRIGIGFGISSSEHVKFVTEVADYAIVGSALIQAQERGELTSFLQALHQA